MLARRIFVGGALLVFLLVSSSASAQNLLVLPFENTGKDPRLDWIGDGLAELSVERLSGKGRLVFSREEWSNALEHLGLPSSARFSHATMIKIAEEVDADFVIFGTFSSDGKTLTATARVLTVDPPGLSPAIEESGPLADLLQVHARLAWRVLRTVDATVPESERRAVDAAPVPRLDAFEQYVRGLTAQDEGQRLRFLREAARLAPDWPLPEFALGQTYLARRDYATAGQWFARVPPEHRTGTEAAFYQGVCLLMRGDAARAEASFSGMAQRAGAAEGFNNLGVAQARQDKWREAAAQWRQAAKVAPEEPDYWFNIGLAALSNSEPAGAVRPFREALARRPQDEQARVLLIVALERSGRMSEAAAEREDSPVETPASLPAPRLKMKLSSPVPVDGVRPNNTAGHRAAHAKLHLSRGEEFLKGGKLEDAQREFSEAVVIDPQLNDARLGLAQVYHLQGRDEDAIRELRAVLWSKDDLRVRIFLGRLYIELERPAEARTELQAALKLDPANREARELLDSVGRPAQGERR